MIQRDIFLFARGPLRLRWLVLGWLLAEFVVFLLLVRLIGLGGTILLGLGTTVLGVAMARRLGTGAIVGLRSGWGGRRPEGALADGMLAGAAALLLIIPGFIANAVGLALSAPSIRRRVVRSIGTEGGLARGPGRPAAPGVIDLEPEDWRPVERP